MFIIIGRWRQRSECLDQPSHGGVDQREQYDFKNMQRQHSSSERTGRRDSGNGHQRYGNVEKHDGRFSSTYR